MYRRVRSEGALLRKFPFSMRYLQAEDIVESRVGFIVRKRTGNAPLRNAMRRVIRDLFRRHASSFARPAWVVFDVYERASETSRAEFRTRAESLLLSLRGNAA